MSARAITSCPSEEAFYWWIRQTALPMGFEQLHFTAPVGIDMYNPQQREAFYARVVAFVTDPTVTQEDLRDFFCR